MERMTVTFPVVLVVLNFFAFTRGDAVVAGDFKGICVLPCSFSPGDEVIVHWIQVTTRDIPVHSYYHNQDQPRLQDQRFRGRASLYKDQISSGNASLQLTGVEVQDQGTYKCYTSTITGNEESLITLKVDAPVRKVDIQQEESRITCSSEGIYPEPELTWSTSPPSHVTFENTTTVQQTEQQLYSISSSLTLTDSATDLTYSCTVSTHRNGRTATLFKETSISGSGRETTIPCTPSNTPPTGLIWRFNHSQLILTQSTADTPYTASDEWRPHVKAVSATGSLTLQDLSSHQEGIYTCELSDAEKSYTKNTILSIETSQESSHTVPVVVGVITAAAVAVTAVLVYFYKKCKGKKEPSEVI